MTMIMISHDNGTRVTVRLQTVFDGKNICEVVTTNILSVCYCYCFMSVHSTLPIVINLSKNPIDLCVLVYVQTFYWQLALHRHSRLQQNTCCQ